MKPAPRWPLHPTPVDGESLSSWLHRVATCYQMSVHELLEHDLGHDQVDDLDIAPPRSLLTALSLRSGVELERLHSMNFAGWVPWLLDSLDDLIPSALETYVFQFSVLLPEYRRKIRLIASWRAWLPSQPIYRACPHCLNNSTVKPILLIWKLPLMLSCPLHGCWLEFYQGLSGHFFGWENTDMLPRTASNAIAVMDKRTWQALATGYVDLPQRRVHAGLWFRLLRTLLDELNTPISQCGTYAGNLRYVWERCGYPFRAGQSLWKPYEILNPAVQLKMLEAAAMAMNLIESEILNPYGKQADLFLPEPQSDFTNGLPTNGNKRSLNPWQNLTDALNAAVAEARHNPDTARSLCDPESLEKLRTLFVEVGIPLEFVSHFNPDEPFTSLRINDGLSDKS
ncbi:MULTISPECIES: TniQ family protein [Xenorhabdus]|uniref:TniQ family protein n=1 Tax=Xenorhabdus TaxID=626 RepID=UPI00064B3176|nr:MULTISPECIES: TniQ family protein [Xenorhabdus]KLU16105.1 TniQ [Xenorhabdus griffiniae]KOP35125.1 TniQ [Xenorhabdus sp. GDc328]